MTGHLPGKIFCIGMSAALLLSTTASAIGGGDINLIPTEETTVWRECVPSANLIDCSGNIDGWERTWKEYVPASYDGQTAVPLLVVLHGGSSHTGHKRTTFHLIADRENFIVLYPESIAEGATWNVWQAKTAEEGMPDDIKYIDTLIAQMQEKYNIDTTRLYITGQSMGDMMCSTYIYERANLFAACAPLSGPTFMNYLVDGENGEVLHTPQYQAPVVRTHGSNDNVNIEGASLEERQRIKRERDITLNNMNWIQANNCSLLPQLGTEGDKCIEIYPGDQPFIFYSVEGGEHNPVLDMADFMWTHFFSNYQRVDGEIVYTPGEQAFHADENAVAITVDSDKAYVNNILVGMDAPCTVIENELSVPVTFLETAFPGTVVTVGEDGRTASITYGDKIVEVSEGWRVAVINNSLKTINLVDVVDGQLMVPFADIAKAVYGMEAAERYNVAYAADHDFAITYDFGYTIRQILGTQKTLTPAESYAMSLQY